MQNYAKEIQVHLHPTFCPPVVKFRGNEPVRVRRVGWGVFMIKILICWKDELGGGVSKFEHMLSWAPHTYKSFVCKL